MSRKLPCGLRDEKRLTENTIALTQEVRRYALYRKALRSKIPRGQR
ncbi:hypothetical protein [Pseudorhodobacter aquimaris]